MSLHPPTLDSVLAALFWCCAAGVVYAYVVYPILICVLARLFGRKPQPTFAPDLPTVALVIAAHNEGWVIEDRIRNALALEYPTDRLKVVVASDGSEDETLEICARHAGSIVPMLFEKRRGKAATLNDVIARLDAEIVVLSDANTFMDRDSVRNLVRWFADPDVGAVCGKLILTDAATGRNADGLYWKYETFLKTREARLGALLGANGGIYAVRRHAFQPLPEGTIVDDFVIPLRAKLATGCRIVYDDEAIAREESAPDIRSEFGRRTRIGIGGWQSLALLWPLLHPRHGWTAFSFWSHKVLRWACPFLLIGALLTSFVLSADRLYAAAVIAQLAFYLACLAQTFVGSHAWMRPLRLCGMFTAMNLALLVGFFRWVRGNQTGIWKRTARTSKTRA